VCVLAGTATGVCLEKGPRMSDISGESTGVRRPAACTATPRAPAGRSRTTETAPDGTPTETEVTTNYPFTNPLSKIFRRLGW
jgi:hypothetical protein